jgi:hypothetical protein
MKATILILMTSSSFLCAQGPQGQQGPPPAPPVLKALDTDGDGKLSASEIEKASEVLGGLDTDGNGRLSKEETRPPRPEGQEEGRRSRREREGERERPMPPIMEALDQNGDGTISKRELKRASQSLLEMDEDESGALESEELKPEKRQEGDSQQRGGSGGQGGQRGDGPRPPHPPRRR